jgi:hypothetical protein
VKKPVFRSDRIHKRFEERNDIVLGHLFNFGDSVNVNPGLLSNLGCRATRRLSRLLECGAGLQLDFEPSLILVLQIPDGLHLGTGIAVNHLFSVRRTGLGVKGRKNRQPVHLHHVASRFTPDASRLLASSRGSTDSTLSRMPFTNFAASSSPKSFANSIASFTVTLAGTSLTHKSS